MVRSTTLTAGALGLVTLLLPFGCSSLLGIEDAELVSDGGAGAGNDGEDLCDRYCDAVGANCTGDFEVYTNKEVCLALCETMDPGTPDDMDVDTVNCRLNQALAAERTGEPADHCPFAGLGGGDVCGNNCDALCRAMSPTCPDEWDSNTACLEDCQALEDLGGFNTGQNSGVTVQCRLWHVGAATQSVSPHCAHAAGAAPCGRAE